MENFRTSAGLKYITCVLQEAKKIRAAADAPRKPPAISDNILPYHEGDLDAPVWQEGGLFDDCF